MHSYYHALSSVKRFGGKSEDYQPIHDWFDESKNHFADFRHRAARHHSEGIFMCERLFGTTITNADGRKIPVRLIGEQHVQEDLGYIPTLADWLRCIEPEPWMMKVAMQSRDLEEKASLVVTYTWPDGKKEVRYRRVAGSLEAQGLINEVEALRKRQGIECPYSYEVENASP